MNETNPSQDGATKPSSGLRSCLKVIRDACARLGTKRDNMDDFYKLSDKELRDIGYERGMLRDISHSISGQARR
jgi:uncharacterized protein YjiS (DUF1127 family)